ncbi:MAG: hypothetical protein ACREL3_02840, partial [Gemmatimonadales bacterium]
MGGILIGILARPELTDLLRWVFFYLFLFSIGHAVGPQFFGSLRREALPQIALTVIMSVTGLVTVIVMAMLLRRGHRRRAAVGWPGSVGGARDGT